MRFKIDENLPNELAQILGELGFNAETVHSENLSGKPDDVIFEVCRRENRVLITLDLDFSNALMLSTFGIIVLRNRKQSKKAVLNLFQKVLPYLKSEKLDGSLWIVDSKGIRIRRKYFTKLIPG